MIKGRKYFFFKVLPYVSNTKMKCVSKKKNIKIIKNEKKLKRTKIFVSCLTLYLKEKIDKIYKTWQEVFKRIKRVH